MHSFPSEARIVDSQAWGKRAVVTERNTPGLAGSKVGFPGWGAGREGGTNRRESGGSVP